MQHRRHYYAQFLHYLERFSKHIAGGVQSDRNERVGRRLYVLHLRIAAGVRLCQLCGPQASIAQCGLSSWRESRHAGNYTEMSPLYGTNLLGDYAYNLSGYGTYPLDCIIISRCVLISFQLSLFQFLES